MRVVFLSNFYNHHQAPFSKKMWKILDGNYAFIATEEMDPERIRLGYRNFQEPFLMQYNENHIECDRWINEADVVIFGSAPSKLIQNRLRDGKLVFQYSERIYKIPPKWYEMPARSVKYYLEKGRYKNMYLLCSSAFTAADYNRTKTFPDRAYKWGYFPEVKHYSIDNLCAHKDLQRILWVGRFLDWKHPDDVLKAAKRLKDNGYTFHVDFGGMGKTEEQLKNMTASMGLSDDVSFLGPIPSDKVRDLMEKSGIYLVTSDRYEGWGAVLNESMNSGCAVVASHAVGAVPYLIKHQHNGLIYHSGDVEELYESIRYFLDNPAEQSRFGRNAYETIINQWNSEIAAERLVKLSECLLAGGIHPDLFAEGPCSKAEVINDNWFDK